MNKIATSDIDPAVAPAARVQDRSEWLHERYRELVDNFGAEPETRSLLTAILEVKAAPDDKEAQLLSLNHCLAEVLLNPLCPTAIYNDIQDHLCEISDSQGHAKMLQRGAFVMIEDSEPESDPNAR